jgi:hypothetical protein
MCVKESYPFFWMYSLPSTIAVTKSCKGNGTTQSFTLHLANTGTLIEDIFVNVMERLLFWFPVTTEIHMFPLQVARIPAAPA